MKLLYRRCAGLDIHKKTVSACIRIRVPGRKEPQIEEAVFGTFTQDLERLRDWLKEHKVKQIAMESTGVYWIPIWNVLEPEKYRFELSLVNPQLVLALRGCKTDRIDAQRIAEFLQYGLLRGSFVPPRSIRNLRDVTRMRVHVQQDRNRLINRIGRLLETVNVKLGSVVSNIVGKTGRAILHAIANGQGSPERLAELAVGSLRHKKPALALALDGRYSSHFRWLLGELMEELERLDGKLAELEWRISDYMQEHQELIRRLCTIPGVNRVSAWTLIAELGTDASVFPDAEHAASWAGLCPGNSESGGKRQSGRTRKGNRYLRRMLTQDAWAVSHKKDCFLTALYYRVASKRGMKKAAVAVAHRILVIAWHILREGGEYREYGGDYFDRQNPRRTAERLTRRLEQIGYDVVLQPRTELPPDAASKDPRGPGRPCKCAERGIECNHHPRPDQPSADERRTPTRPQPPPVPPAVTQQCSRCRKWGIPCIHARNAKISPLDLGTPSKPST